MFPKTKKLKNKSLKFSFILTTTTLILLPIILSINSNPDERIIKLKDLDLENKETYIPVKSGQFFTIELEGNPSTGYGWFVEDPEKLEREGLLKAKNLDKNNSGEYYRKEEEIFSTENEPIRLGGGGIYHFKFLAEKNGHEEITFIYKRPWDNTDQVKKTLNIKVVNVTNMTRINEL